MAIIRKKEIPRFSEQELKERIKDLNIELLKISAQKGQSAGTSKKIREIKRTIARINAQLNQIKS